MFMKNPEILVTHHGADARLLTFDEMVEIYQKTHHERLYKKYRQPRSSFERGPDIAYHILVGKDKWGYARDLSLQGYHAGNYPVNLNSIAIVVTGDYMTMELDHKIEGMYRDAVAEIRQEVPSLNRAGTHRMYANRTCPGVNITDEFVKSVFDNPSGNVKNPKAVQHIYNALVDLQKATNELK